jgi:A/G-specific adenine glycosylase
MYSESAIREFQNRIWHYYYRNRREMPWRLPVNGIFDPYRILVSEIMLQQTQVARVIPKYEAFIKRFPDIQSLASASLADVLVAWSGLGYNRRAKYLHRAAQHIVTDFDGQFPETVDVLVSLPGIGINTAGAIAAYAYNKPVVFVETNIRSVIIMYFFQDATDVKDKEIAAAASAVLDQSNPREWYWALMDYGAHLKSTAGNHARRAKVYAKQSKFEGSVRQVRGKVLQVLRTGPVGLADFQRDINDDRLPGVLESLVAEELIQLDKNTYRLAQ